MEGTQREIGSSEIPFIQCNKRQLPRDHLQLKINSNHTYSRTLHPNNNCYSFMIEFKQPAAESLQHRINQYNKYQVLSIQLPIRSFLGLIYNSPHHHHAKTSKTSTLGSTSGEKIQCNDTTPTDDFTFHQILIRQHNIRFLHQYL